MPFVGKDGLDDGESVLSFAVSVATSSIVIALGVEVERMKLIYSSAIFCSLSLGGRCVGWRLR